MKKLTIAIDVDGVCADLITPWLRRYNCDWEDNLQPEQIHEYRIEKFVRPECGMAIYDYINDPSIYDEVLPIEGAIEGVRRLRAKGHDICFATASPASAMGRKFYWLSRFGFLKTIDEYIEISAKHLLRVDALIDDNPDMILKMLRSPGAGVGLLFWQPWNKTSQQILGGWDWAGIDGLIETNTLFVESEGERSL